MNTIEEEKNKNKQENKKKVTLMIKKKKRKNNKIWISGTFWFRPLKQKPEKKTSNP